MRAGWRLGARFAVWAVLSAVLVFGAGGAQVGAQFSQQAPPSQVTFDVNDTILVVEGSAPPGSLVTILRDGVTIGTVVAAGGGSFSRSFSAQTAGLHKVSVFASVGGETTDTVSREVSLAAQAQTTVEFFLPTTLQMPSSQVVRGTPVILSGLTIPNSTVTLRLDNNFSAQAKADASGKWSYKLSTDNLYIGLHSVFAVVNDGLGGQSFPTSQRTFRVSGPPGQGAPSAPAPPAHIPAPRISEPRDGRHFSDAVITVYGVASPNTQVELWDGNAVVGSVFANQLGKWKINYQLSEEKHQLNARACTGGRCSGFSDTVTVFLDSMQPPGSLSLGLGAYGFMNIAAGSLIVLEITFSGGAPPYQITVDWGDTKRNTWENIPVGQVLTAKHRYDHPGQYTGSVLVRDSEGTVLSRNFSVAVVQPGGKRVLIATGVGAVMALAAVLLMLYFGGVRRRRKSDEE